MDDNVDRVLTAFKKLVPYLRGALWWANNDILKERLDGFNKRDRHVGHPVLSMRKDEVESRIEVVPMLLGTSGGSMSINDKRCCIDVVGMTREDRTHHTYFGSIIEPLLVTVEDMLKGAEPQKGDYLFGGKDRHMTGPSSEKAILRIGPRLRSRSLMPNWDKPTVDADERDMVDCYCSVHKL